MFRQPLLYYTRWFFASSYAIFFTAVSPAKEPQPIEDSVVDEQPIEDYERDHWSYYPIDSPPVPAVQDPAWCQTPIDRFILATLESEGLRPAPKADRSTLVRRLSWDLTGLPPNSVLAKQFAADDASLSYDQLVDQLLASPDQAEHAAQFWLDLARFAETDGFEHDKVRPTAWQYRDWVVKAFAHDLPYDQFIRWQLAGDQLEPDNDDAQLATAFCVSGPDMPDINLLDERRHVLLNEITSTVGSVVMALQFGCAQCHDHMYDSISQGDFYRLRAFFDDAVELKKNKSVTMLTSVRTDRPSRLMTRGDFRRPGPIVQAAYPRLLNADEDYPDAPVGKRAALANWLTSQDHPLTARVIVNRVWQMHFGRGLVSTPSDFGVLSDEPSHPELLDYLASQLIENRWSLKWLHRQIVCSSVYQTRSQRPTDAGQLGSWDQALQSDPENRWLARYPRRRLTGEAIRDGMLLQSDALNREMGGAGFRPPLPDDMVKTLLNGQWNVTKDQSQHGRRSLYLFARRNLRYPFFATFDRPSADQPCACRDESTTAVQSLTLFNSALSMTAAQNLADALIVHSKETDEQVEEAFWRVFSRGPDQSDREATLQFLSSQLDLIRQEVPTIDRSVAERLALIDLCRTLLNSSGFVYFD